MIEGIQKKMIRTCFRMNRIYNKGSGISRKKSPRYGVFLSSPPGGEPDRNRKLL
jgi:hypothetical protein